MSHRLLEDFHQGLDDLGLVLFLTLQDNRIHLVELVFTHVEGGFGRDTRVGVLDLETELVVVLEGSIVVGDSLVFFLQFHVGTGCTDVGGNQLFLVFLVHLDEVVVFGSGEIPLLRVSIGHRDGERGIESVGALRIVADEILGAADGFVGHLGFVVAQAGAVQEARGLLVLRVALVGKFVSDGSVLLIRDGVVDGGSKADRLERHGILREVVRDEEERGRGKLRLVILLVSGSGTEHTLDGERRSGIFLRELHEGFSSLRVLVGAFESGSRFEDGLVGDFDLRVALHESEVGVGALLVLAFLHGLFSHLVKHECDSLLGFLGHRVVLGGLHLRVLLQQPFEFGKSFIELVGFEQGLGKHLADEQDVLMVRVLLAEFAENRDSRLELLGIVMHESGVVRKFCGFLVLAELLHVLVHLSEVGLRFGEAVSLDRIALGLGLQGFFTSLVHHEHGVVRSFFLLQEGCRTEGTTAVTGRIGIDDPVEHLGGVRMLAHFLVGGSEVDMDGVFIPGRLVLVAVQESLVSLDGFGIALLTALDITFLGDLRGLLVMVVRNFEHSAADSLVSVRDGFLILGVLLAPRGVLVVALHHHIAVLLGFVKLLLDEQDFDHGNIGERSVDVVRVDLHQALEGLHGFFVTVMVLVLHTDAVVHGILERNLLVLEEGFSFGDTTTFQVGEGGRHEVHSFGAEVVGVFTLVGTDDVFVVLVSSRFVFGNVVVGFSQVVHGEGRFLTREVLEAGHLLVGGDSVLELAVHEVVFSDTEPCLRHETVVREVLDEAFTKLESLRVFATRFLHGSSLIEHHRNLRGLRVLVDVFEEVAQSLLVVGLRILTDVCALGRLVITVGTPGHIFFVLGLDIQELLFFEHELVVTQLLESAGTAVRKLALTGFALGELFPLGNSLLHAFFIKAAGTASLFGLVLDDLIGIGALFITRFALSDGLALGKHFFRFASLFLTRIRCGKGSSDKGAHHCRDKNDFFHRSLSTYIIIKKGRPRITPGPPILRVPEQLPKKLHPDPSWSSQ